MDTTTPTQAVVWAQASGVTEPKEQNQLVGGFYSFMVLIIAFIVILILVAQGVLVATSSPPSASDPTGLVRFSTLETPLLTGPNDEISLVSPLVMSGLDLRVSGTLSASEIRVQPLASSSSSPPPPAYILPTSAGLPGQLCTSRGPGVAAEWSDAPEPVYLPRSGGTMLGDLRMGGQVLGALGSLTMTQDLWVAGTMTLGGGGGGGGSQSYELPADNVPSVSALLPRLCSGIGGGPPGTPSPLQWLSGVADTVLALPSSPTAVFSAGDFVYPVFRDATTYEWMDSSQVSPPPPPAPLAPLLACVALDASSSPTPPRAHLFSRQGRVVLGDAAFPWRVRGAGPYRSGPVSMQLAVTPTVMLQFVGSVA